MKSVVIRNQRLKDSRAPEGHFADLVFYQVLRALGLLVFAIFILLFAFLVWYSMPALSKFGGAFLTSSSWNPVRDDYGAAPFVFGTAVTSIFALILAVPISVGTALFLSQSCPRFLEAPIGFLIEMLAAIPSVVYGLWGITILAPALRLHLQPFLSRHFGYLPLFEGAPLGVGLMAAGIILAIMIVPTITSVAREVFDSVPKINFEGALALGATRWEAMRLTVLRSGAAGVLGAVVLGLGRAVGETMAVAMVIGNRAEISTSLFRPGATMASVIANEYAEATSTLHLSSLMAVGLALFCLSFVVNLFARLIIARMRRLST